MEPRDCSCGCGFATYGDCDCANRTGSKIDGGVVNCDHGNALFRAWPAPGEATSSVTEIG